jgi:hypothetical protein
MTEDADLDDATDQLDDIQQRQQRARRAGNPDLIYSTQKSERNWQNRADRIRSSKDLDDD